MMSTDVCPTGIFDTIHTLDISLNQPEPTE